MLHAPPSPARASTLPCCCGGHGTPGVAVSPRCQRAPLLGHPCMDLQHATLESAQLPPALAAFALSASSSMLLLDLHRVLVVTGFRGGCGVRGRSGCRCTVAVAAVAIYNRRCRCRCRRATAVAIAGAVGHCGEVVSIGSRGVGGGACTQIPASAPSYVPLSTRCTFGVCGGEKGRGSGSDETG